MDKAVEERAQALFWVRSQPYLQGPPTDLRALWEQCVAEAERDAAHSKMLDGVERVTTPLLAAGLVAVEFKDLPPGELWQTKSGDDFDGSVEGYLAVFGNEDLVKDIIEPGAFTKTLADAEAFKRAHRAEALLPLLWQHDKDEPIGAITQAKEDRHGLRIACRVNRSIERGRQAYDGLKGGYLSFSIGYKPVKYQWMGAVRHLQEIKLAEGSVVTFPANPEARVAA